MENNKIQKYMENIKKYIIQQTIINNMNNNQITFFNSIISDIDKTHYKKEKELKKDILQQLLQDYKLYKINKTMDDIDVMDTGKYGVFRTVVHSECL